MAGGRTIPTCKSPLLSAVALAITLPSAAQADAGAYVRARAAAAEGAVDAAAVGYAAALANAPGDEVVAQRAYRNALAAGDLVLARKAATVLRRSNAAPLDAAILDMAEAVRRKDWPGATGALERIGAGPLDFLAPIVRAWIAQASGGDPIATLDDANDSNLGRRYFSEHRALLLIARGRGDEGVAAIREAIGLDTASFDLRWNAAQLLAAKGKRKAALDLLPGDAAEAQAYSTALRNGVKPGVAFGAGRALTRIASDLADQQASQLSIVLTRAALLLDPDDDRARILLGAALGASGAIDSALATLVAIRPDSPFHAAAQSDRVRLIQQRGDPAAAIVLAASLASRAGASITDHQRYAGLLVEAGREREAARAYAAALASAGTSASWSHHLQLGGALERAGEWQAALPHLRRAVALGPDQPIALNYLGYALVDRGQNLAEGQALLERASALRPDDPSITDSLGWAYYRTGDIARALPLLERAAAGNPASATINEHLGDAYWRSGRRYEARYAWRAAAVVAQGEQLARITTKVAEGLPLETLPTLLPTTG